MGLVTVRELSFLRNKMNDVVYHFKLASYCLI